MRRAAHRVGDSPSGQNLIPDLKRQADLAACASHPETPPDIKVIRYQEKAVLDAHGAVFEYVRPADRRASQYDLWGHVRAPKCGDVILGPADVEWRECTDRVPVTLVCGLTVFRCDCDRASPEKKKASESRL